MGSSGHGSLGVPDPMFDPVLSFHTRGLLITVSARNALIWVS